MKKLFLLLATAAVTSGAYAEGYQVNNLSPKQNGMGHVGTAMKLNSDSIWFNPADASFQDTRFDISVGITGIPRYALGAWPDVVDADGTSRVVSGNGGNGFYPWIDLEHRAYGVVGVQDDRGAEVAVPASQRVAVAARQAYGGR